jgi:hypothetical protein
MEPSDRGVSRVSDGVGAIRLYQDFLYGPLRDDPTRREIAAELLRRYFRLDTAAMVMVWKHRMSGVTAQERP